MTIRVLVADELGDLLEYPAAAAQVASAWQRQVERRAGAGRIADVVDEQSQRCTQVPVCRPRNAIPGCSQYT